MKTAIICFFAAFLSCSPCQARWQRSGNDALSVRPRSRSLRFIEDCITTQMKIVDGKRFNGDVYRSIKLQTGEGAIVCNNICRADIDCWSWNFSQKRRSCALMDTAEDAGTKKDSLFTAGYRSCVDTDAAFDNAAMDFGDDPAPYTPTNVVTTPATTSVGMTWDDPALAATNYDATFNALCVSRGASCYALPLGKLSKVAEGAGKTAQTVPSLPSNTKLTCYVQTVVGGSVMACSVGVNTATTA